MAKMKKKKSIPSVGKDVERLAYPHPAAGRVIRRTGLENCLSVSAKAEPHTLSDPAMPLLRLSPTQTPTYTHQKPCTRLFIAAP